MWDVDCDIVIGSGNIVGNSRPSIIANIRSLYSIAAGVLYFIAILILLSIQYGVYSMVVGGLYSSATDREKQRSRESKSGGKAKKNEPNHP
jgi:hypothetical protein